MLRMIIRRSIAAPMIRSIFRSSGIPAAVNCEVTVFFGFLYWWQDSFPIPPEIAAEPIQIPCSLHGCVIEISLRYLHVHTNHILLFPMWHRPAVQLCLFLHLFSSGKSLLSHVHLQMYGRKKRQLRCHWYMKI